MSDISYKIVKDKYGLYIVIDEEGGLPKPFLFKERSLYGCPFVEGWVNQEGWFIFNGKLICLDWDDYCTLCRIDDSNDCEFDVVKSSQLGFEVPEKCST